MLYIKHKAFTLVELIVVVTILAILATIGFVSYSSYLTGVRDTNRISQLTSISDGLNLYSTKNSLPIPDDNVEVSYSGTLTAYQGTAGANTLETIDFTKGGKDPRDDTYFSYYLTKDRKHFQLMGFLEESSSSSSAHGSIDRVYAADYADRIATVTGRKLGILTNDQNTPLEQLGTDLDITPTLTGYKAYLDDLNVLEDAEVIQLESIIKSGGRVASSCKKLLEKVPELQGSDGEYLMSISSGNFQNIYCDMTTDGGGRTFFLHVDGSEVSTDFFANPIGIYMSDRSDTGAHYSLSSKIFEHTEMMFTANSVDPATSTHLVRFKYTQGDPMFNKGPVPCEGSPEFQFSQGIDGVYQNYGTATACNSTWYTRTGPGSADYLILFNPSASYQGNYFISSPGWGKDGYWYLR